MKNFLAVMGAIFIVLLIVGGAVFGYNFYAGNRLDKDSQAFIDSTLPKIMSNWDIAAFSANADYEAMKDANISDKQMGDIFKWTSGRLGKMTEYDGSQGQAYIQDINGTKIISGQYTVYGKFEHGDAKILVTILLSKTQGWKIAGFNVNSPAFANIPSTGR